MGHTRALHTLVRFLDALMQAVASKQALINTTINATSSSIWLTSRSAGSSAMANNFFTASEVEKKPPTKNSSVATTNEARYLARYRPNG